MNTISWHIFITLPWLLISAGLIYFWLLLERAKVLEQICGESYQVIGILADETGRFDDPAVIKALDNASSEELMHDDVLPFPCKQGKPTTIIPLTFKFYITDFHESRILGTNFERVARVFTQSGDFFVIDVVRNEFLTRDGAWVVEEIK